MGVGVFIVQNPQVYLSTQWKLSNTDTLRPINVS